MIINIKIQKNYFEKGRNNIQWESLKSPFNEFSSTLNVVASAFVVVHDRI